MPAAPPRTLTSTRWLACVALALLVLVAVMTASLLVGSTGKFGLPQGPLADEILRTRWDKVLLATLVGAALAGAGCAYQAVLRNDLADPYLLGIASGAALASYLWRLPIVAGYLATSIPFVAAISQQGFAFAGAIAASFVVLAIAGARGRFEPTTLILTGVIVSTVCAALMMLIFTLVKSLPGSGYYQSVLIGELQTSLTASQVITSAVLVTAGLIVIGLRLPILNLVALSSDEARSLGVNVSRERAITLIAASLVTAAAVSVSGPIGFVGLIAPHVARRVVGVDLRVMMPISCVGGAVLLVVADAILRYLAGVHAVNTIIPISVATALLGGPFFLVLLFQKRKGDA
jgi:iron complex transport system permease protein